MYDAASSYGLYQSLFLLAICLSTYVLLKYYIIGILLFVAVKAVSIIHAQFYTAQVDAHDRGVFITGCDTGLGNRFASYLDERGFTVFAGCLNTNSPGAESLLAKCSSRLQVVEIDVKRNESVSEAFCFVQKHLPNRGLWGVINNAGMDMIGDVELSPVSLYEKCFDLNLYGYIRVLQTFLPLIRQSKGRVINVSSVRGRIVEPNQCNYSTSKHCLETLSDSLRLEMIKFGVSVSIIEPGAFGNATAIGSEAVIRRNRQEVEEMWRLTTDEVKISYSKRYLQSWIHTPVGGWPPKADSTVVAKAVAHALCSSKPKHRYLVQGKGSIVPFFDEYVVLSLVHNLLPTWIVDKYIALWKGCNTRPTMASD